jgi:hypothetical protein
MEPKIVERQTVLKAGAAAFGMQARFRSGRPL